jgi:hypothetical protein
MGIRKSIMAGLISGLIMGIALFIVGAIASRLIYGPQFAPTGKFEPEQMNAWYFIWTKLVIGAFFGVLFTLLYEAIPLSKRIDGVWKGVAYGFWFWLAISLWNLSHPLVYGSIEVSNQVFWLIYSLGGFLAYGGALGYIHKRMAPAGL